MHITRHGQNITILSRMVEFNLIIRRPTITFNEDWEIAMRRHVIIYCVLAYVLIGFGCASDQNGPGSHGRGKDESLQAKGELICQDVKSGKMWQVEKKGVFSSPQEAEAYAADLILGGYDDWRLPTKAEMFNLFHVFVWKQNTYCVMNRSGEFWTVSENGKSSPGHWELNYSCGPEYKYVESIKTKGYVRAVRP
jgi:hypothetical protein